MRVINSRALPANPAQRRVVPHPDQRLVGQPDRGVVRTADLATFATVLDRVLVALRKHAWKAPSRTVTV